MKPTDLLTHHADIWHRSMHHQSLSWGRYFKKAGEQ